MAKAAKCDPQVYEKGEPIACVAGVASRIIDAVVQEAAEHAGCKMDWHYVGGRANVLTLGDPHKSAKCLRQVLESLPVALWNCDGACNAHASLEQQERSMKALLGR